MKNMGSERKMKTGYNKYWSAVILFMGLAFIASPANAIGTMIVAAIYSTFTFTTGMYIAAMAINIAVSMIVSKNAASGLDGALSGASQNPGNRQSAPPATNNKLPVVYGSAWVGGTVVDMSISTDNQWMYYVIALSEVTGGGDTFTFGDVYMGGRKCVFSSTDPYKVTGLQDPSTLVTDSAVNGNLYVYLYRNGTNSNVNSPYTAYQIMNGGGSFTVNTVYKWTVQQMTNCAFAIVQMKYSQQANTTGFQQMKFQINNPRNAPGDCFLDYLTNEVYGAGLTIDQVDTDSLTALNTYCAEPFTYTTYGGSTTTQTRFQFNGVIDTSRAIMDNLQEMATSCDCLIKYNEITGLWGVIVQQSTYTVAMDINDSNMIGALSVSPLDIANSYNVIEAKFPDVSNQDSFNTATFDLAQLAPTLLYPNEPINKQSVTLSLVNNNVTAQYIANRLLEAGREDLNITCKIDYTGLQLEAGDIVTVTNTNYGWAAKLFRVNKITENFGSDGTITADLMLSEFNPQVFDDKDITQFTPAANTGLPNALTFGTLAAPIITNQTPTAPAPFFYVTVTTPNNGVAQYAEIYYSASADGSNPIFAGTTEVKPSGNGYAAGEQMPPVVLTGIASGNWYFFYKIVNGLGTSGLSLPSNILYWRPNAYQYPDRYIMLAYSDYQTNAGAVVSIGTYILNFNNYGNTWIYASTDPSSVGVAIGQYVTGAHIQPNTQIVDIVYDPSEPVYQYWVTLSKDTTNVGEIFETVSFSTLATVSYSPRNKTYFGIRNTNAIINSTIHSDYQWYPANPTFNTTNYLLYSNWGNRSISYATGTANYYGGESDQGNFVSTNINYSGAIWSGVIDPVGTAQSYIDLDQQSGQNVLTGSTTNYGSLAVQPSTDGRLQVALNKFISFGVDGGGAEILQKTVQPAFLTVDIYGRVVGFENPDNFYMTIKNFTATSGQTVFSVTRDASYKINNCLVFQNGILVDTSEYTDTAGSTGTVTFSSGRTLNDAITIISFRSYHLANSGSFIIGTSYTIVALGTTNWNGIGYVGTPAVGGTFTATGVGTGTGTASTIYNSFTRFTQSITNASVITPTTPITSGFEYLFFNGTAMLDPDYDIDVNGNIFNMPANMTGTVTVIQWAANNLSTPNGNPYVVLANTASGVTSYTFGLTQYAFNLYENGVLQINGTTTPSTFSPSDYTTISGGYTLGVSPTSNTNFLLQQSFTRTGAA